MPIGETARVSAAARRSLQPKPRSSTKRRRKTKPAQKPEARGLNRNNPPRLCSRVEQNPNEPASQIRGQRPHHGLRQQNRPGDRRRRRDERGSGHRDPIAINTLHAHVCSSASPHVPARRARRAPGGEVGSEGEEASAARCDGDQSRARRHLRCCESSNALLSAPLLGHGNSQRHSREVSTTPLQRREKGAIVCDEVWNIADAAGDR